MRDASNQDHLNSGLALKSRSVLLGFSALISSAPCFAESAESVLEEVVVSARKRDEQLQDVPISMSVLSHQALARMGADAIEDIGRAVPNVSIPDNSVKSRTPFSIRGIFSDTRNLGFEDSITVYVDGVPVGRHEGFNLDLGDVERVEVLRGPQGTLFGRNTIAGALNVISRVPDQEFGVHLTARRGNFDYTSLRGAVNVPLTETVAFRASLGSVKRDGLVTNAAGGPKLDALDSYNGRAQLLLTPTQDFRMLLQGDLLDADGLTTGGQEPLFDGPFTVDLDHRRNIDRRRVGGTALTMDYSGWEGRTLTSISAYRFADVRLSFDQDLTSLPSFYVDFRDETRQFSQELRLSSDAYAWGDYVVGLFYLNQSIDYDRPFFDGVTNTPMLWNVGTVESDSYAAFAHSNVHLTGQLTAFVGLRYSIDEKHNTFTQPSGAFGLPAIATDVQDRSDDALSYTVGLKYALSDATMLYGSVATGYKAGGFNNDFVASTGRGFSFGPEDVVSYEAGYKSTFWSGRGLLNASVFYMDYTDLQVTRRTAISYIISNADAVSKGVELEIGLHPLRGLQLNAAVGYTDAYYTDYLVDESSGQRLDGNRLARAPKWTVGLSADYEYDLADRGTLAAKLDYTYIYEQFTDPTNLPVHVLPDSKQLNGRVGYISRDERWELFLWGRNLTDELILTQHAEVFGVEIGSYQPPRTYGVEITAHF